VNTEPDNISEKPLAGTQITIFKHLKSYLICILSNTSEDGSIAWQKLKVHFMNTGLQVRFLVCKLKKRD
jgi:hypothetical protein